LTHTNVAFPHFSNNQRSGLDYKLYKKYNPVLNLNLNFNFKEFSEGIYMLYYSEILATQL